MLSLRPPPSIARRLMHSHTPVLVSAALAFGLLIARLPVTYSLAVLAAAVLVAASVLEPAIGVGAAIAFGPAKAVIAIARPDLPADLGQLFFALAVAGWLARGLMHRKIVIPRLPLLLPFALYLGAGALSLLPATSLEEGLKELLKWAEIVLAMLILLSEFERGRVKWVIAAILVAGAAQAAIGVWQFQFRENGPEGFRILGEHSRAYGTFEQPNPFGGFLGLIWPVAAGLAIGSMKYEGERRQAVKSDSSSVVGRPSSVIEHSSSFIPHPSALLFAALAALMLASLYFSFSRGAWLGAAAAGLVMAMFLPRRLGLGVGLVTAALIGGWVLASAGLLPSSVSVRLAEVADFVTVSDVRGVNINDVNFAIVERLAHWQAAYEMARAHPWLGVGIGNYAAAYPAYRLFNWEDALGHAHMIYLNVLAETGVLGLVTYVILWASIIALTIRVARRGRASGWRRGLALGLLGVWTHLSVHQVVDNLYVNNIHFLIAGLLALLIYLSQDASPLPLSARRGSGTGAGGRA